MPLMVFLLLAFALPVSLILFQAVWLPGQGFSSVPVARLLGAPVYAKVMWRTLEIAAWVTLWCLMLGYPLAYAIHKAKEKSRQALYLLVLLPLWTSFMVKTFAWLVILGKNGVVNTLLITLFGPDAAQSMLFDMGAVLIGMVHGLLPFAVLSILPVLDATDARLVPAAQSMGASPLRAFIRITLPLSSPGIAAAALIIFVTSLGFFIVPALLGGPRQTMAPNLIIELVLELLNWPLASAASLAVFAIVAMLFALFIKGFGIESLIGRARVQAPARKAQRLGARAWVNSCIHFFDNLLAKKAKPTDRSPAWLRTMAWVAGLFLALPALFLIPVSFSSSGIIDWPPQGFSLKWYAALGSAGWREAAWRSFTVAIATGVLSLALAFPAARWFVQHARGMRHSALVLMLAPMIVPRVILAIGLFYVLAKLHLVGSWMALVVGHTVIALPFVMITLIAVVQGYDDRLDAAASACGASTWQRLRKITLPILAPGLLSAFLFAFVTSLDELTIALFLTGGLSSTIPKQMWDEALLKVSPTLAAASTVLLVLMSVIVLLAQNLRKR
jgi:putative spermidine/putrescine transport system permease protein